MGDSSVTSFLPPRDTTGPVACAVCGCRLLPAAGADDGAWRHFPSLMAGQDARGCRPYCVDEMHGHDGRPISTGLPATDASTEVAA